MECGSPPLIMWKSPWEWSYHRRSGMVANIPANTPGRESKTSRLYYDLNPLKYVPVPAYDPDNATHRRVAPGRPGKRETGFDTDVVGRLEKAVAALLTGWGPLPAYPTA